MDFTQYKSHFLATFARSRTSFAAMPGTPSLAQVTSVHYPLSIYLSIYLTPLSQYPQSNWKEAGPKTGLPAVGLKLADLVARLQSAYQLTTAGKFTEAITRSELEELCS